MIHWTWHHFSDLSAELLYDMLAFRQRIFVVEQQCIYHDLDDVDKYARHLVAREEKRIVAYLRLYEKDHQVYFGRVATDQSVRGRGIGKQLVEQVLTYAKQHLPDKPIIISAQLHLTDFYSRFGFATIGQAYDEDGIMHIDMNLDIPQDMQKDKKN